MKRISTLFFCTIIIAFFSISPVSGQQEPEQDGIAKVKAEEVRERLLYETISTSGLTSPAKHSRLSFHVPGVVEEVLVETGDEVRKNQPLAVLDDATYKLAVEQAKASLESAQAALAKLNAGFRTEEIKQAKAAVDAAEARRKQARRDYERAEELVREKKVMSDNALEQAKTALDLAQASYEQAVGQLELMKKGFQEEDIKAATAQVSVAETALKMARKNLEETVLTAPYDGTIVRTYVDPGDSAGGMPGAPAVEIVDVTSLEITASVPDIWSEQVAKGSRAIIDIDGRRNGIEAKIASTCCVIDPVNRSFEARLKIENPEGKMKAGMFARIRIIYSEKTALAVPTSAVLEDAQLRYVFIYDKGRVKKKKVETGIESEGYTEISEGLEAGQLVIHEGNFGLSEGTEVKLQRED